MDLENSARPFCRSKGDGFFEERFSFYDFLLSFVASEDPEPNRFFIFAFEKEIRFD